MAWLTHSQNALNTSGSGKLASASGAVALRSNLIAHTGRYFAAVVRVSPPPLVACADCLCASQLHPL